MSKLVVYFTRSGHSKMIAESVGKIWNADVSEIIDLNKRTGFLSFLQSAYDARQDKVTEIKMDRNPEDYDEVIVVSPIWGGTIPPAINTYVRSHKVNYGIISSGGPIIPEKLTPVKAKIKVDKLLALSKKEWQTTDKIESWLNNL